MQNCSNSIALAMELLESGTKPLKYNITGCIYHFDGLMQICFISIADTMEILLSSTSTRIV